MPDAIAKVKSGHFAGVHVDMIATAGAVEAIPILKQQFVRVEDDPLLKAKIAAALVRLGDKDNTYWDFLVKFATPPLQSDAPDFVNYDSRGKAIPGPSPEFVAWADSHNLPHAGLLEESVYMLPGWGCLSWLEQGCKGGPVASRSPLVSQSHDRDYGGKGLAEIGDKDSIPFIIEACKKAPTEAASVIAESLVYFDDHSAQSAVDRFIPQDQAKIYRDAKAHGRMPLSSTLYDKLPDQ